MGRLSKHPVLSCGQNARHLLRGLHQLTPEGGKDPGGIGACAPFCPLELFYIFLELGYVLSHRGGDALDLDRRVVEDTVLDAEMTELGDVVLNGPESVLGFRRLRGSNQSVVRRIGRARRQ